MPTKERAEKLEKIKDVVDAPAAIPPDFFSSSLGARLTAEGVVGEIMKFMRAEPECHYKVTIGTDSELLSTKYADFVTAIVVHRVGNGGRYFWRRFELGKFYTLRDRIIREVLISLDVAKEILAELKKPAGSSSEGFHSETSETDLPEFEFEIHADIGMNGPTNAVIQEVMGMIRAHNFEPKMKPESYAASNVADRHV
jgi:predicted RNase H-related nuclease YkuK (DUF458 family)